MATTECGLRMEYKIAFFFVFLFLTSCSTFNNGEKLTLNWSHDGNRPHHYEVSIINLDKKSAPKLDYKKAIQSDELFKSELSKIENLNPDENTHVATVTFKDGEYEGRMSQTVLSEDSEKKHQVVLLGYFDKHGNSSSFYLYQKQKNLLNLFFDVPDIPVNKDTTWERDIYITQIGQSFVPQLEKRKNINRLIDTSKNAEGDVLAHIGGINHEEVSGNYEFASSDSLMPVSIKSTHYFYGVFNVTQGYWEYNTTVAYMDEQDSGLFGGVTVYAIKKVDH
jgi:hypothetical protein